MLRRCAISLMLLAAACAWGRTRPHYGGTLRVEIAGAPWQGADALARRLVMDGLTGLDANGAVRPALAATWQASDNYHRWEFRLRPGVRFHDGSPLTAEAVTMSLNLSCNGSCPWSAVRPIGALAVVFTSDSPLPHLPALLTQDEFLIALTRGTDGLAPAQPTGTGAFRVVASAGNVVTLAANEDCWQGRPFLDQVVLTAHRAVRDQWLDMQVGRADVVEVPAEQLRQAQQQRMTIVASPPVTLLALELSGSGVLANSMLRSAIAHAVDRTVLYNVIFQKQGEVTASLLPQELSGYSFLFPPDRDLNKATELRGGINVPPLALRFEGDGTMQLTAQRLALNLHEAGFNVQMTGSTQRADLLLTELPIAGSDPAGVLATLLERAGQQPSFAGDKPEVLYRVERDVLDQHTIVPLLDLPRAWSISERVHNFSLSADGTPDLASASVEDAP